MKKQLPTIFNVLLKLWLVVCGMIALHYFLLVTTWSSFNVPSNSMLPTLQPGDYMLVNKWVMGGRIFNLREAAGRRQFPVYRLPGFSGLERNDVMVFNAPYPDASDSLFMDPLLFYVKRCIALPGDTMEIRNGYYRVRGVNEPPGNLRSQRMLSVTGGYMPGNHLTDAFPHDSVLGWTIKDFGPLHVPARGQEVRMDSTGWKLYRSLIAWEQKKRVTRMGNDVYLNDSLIRRYRFRENYYFAGGDNMESSYDSRYWGLVPEPFIAGKAVRIWKSVNPHTGRICWKRIWKKIE